MGVLVAIAAQLALVLVVMHVFKVEQNRGFLRLTTLIFGGFLVHALLPLRLRMPFFLALSLAAFVTLLGFPQSMGLIAIGLALIGLCHLPVAFGLRVALVVAFAAVLAAIRAGWLETPWEALPTLVLPILGAMFMFRLMLYLYDLRHERKPATVWERLSYFFLLPNVCFLLFPVVDYQTFRRTYYDKDAAEIYQKGVLWIFRGVTHLILYRLVYYYFVTSPSEVQTLGQVVQYMVATYLLYLRISGQFHLIIGILALFGFNLPETHHLYYLASSFNDYWRRINIYWKDFMMKLFYYPSFMRLRKLGMTTGLVLATLVVFVGTWVLHSYQWFWLRGQFPITLPDALFWGILGVMVAVNAVSEVRRGRKRRLGKEAWQLRASVVYSVKVVGMFVLITVLWTLWSSSSVGEFVSLLGVAASSSAVSWLWLALGLVALVGVGVWIQWLTDRGVELSVTGSNPSFRRAAVYTGAGALALVLLGLPRVQGLMGARGGEVIASLQESRFNERDAELLDRGYYEGLLETGRFTTQLWEAKLEMPKDWAPLTQSGLVRNTGGMMRYELVPSHEMTYHRAPLSTNRWGMRDRDYEKAKPEETYRIALLGASYEMGSGVADSKGFEPLVEERLNRELAGAGYDRFEILNFAVGGYSVIQHVYLLESKIAEFQPDAIFCTGHSGDAGRALLVLSQLVEDGVPLPPGLEAIRERAGITPGMDATEYRRRLSPFGEDILRWGYERIVALSRQMGAVPVWVFVPRTDGIRRGEEPERLRKIAEEAGFLILDLDGAYGDEDPRLIRLAPWDAHPNPQGHSLLAEKLFEAIRAHDDSLGLNLKMRSVHMQQTH